MRNLRGTYVHRGDAARKRRRISQALFLAGTVLATYAVVNDGSEEDLETALSAVLVKLGR